MPADTLARINADVAARRYTGVADYDEYRDAPQDRFAGFYDPDEAAPTAGPYAGFPRYPDLLDAAQKPFSAAGLDVPWYISRGNHDGLVQGNAPASEDLFRAIATGCLKVFPNAQFDPSRFAGQSADELFAAFGDPAFIQSLLAGGKTVPPDPDRRIITKAEYRSLIGHGFSPDAAQGSSRPRTAPRATTRGRPKKGFRFVSLDTVAEGGGQSGNIDDPQYKWLRGELRAAKRKDQLVVAFGHHTLGTMDNARKDEGAGKCSPRRRAGLRPRPAQVDPDPSRHQGQEDDRALLAGTPNVIAYVAGHTHANRVDFYKGRKGRGFWQINTASHIDWPQQSRDDRGDGQPRRHAVAVRDDAGLGGARRRSGAGHRRAAASRPRSSRRSAARCRSTTRSARAWRAPAATRRRRGRRADRNVELLVKDPR